MSRMIWCGAACGAIAVASASCGATVGGEPEVAFTVLGTGTAPTTPTTAAPMESAKDKPCVAAHDVPEAAGKPEVAVPVGPPPTELVKTDITVGTGAEAKVGDTIKVHYVGIACSTGEQFDSSWDRGDPASFPLTEGGLIQGWIDGIPGMKVGGRRQLVIPSNLAYKEQGRAPQIAPDEALIFVIDLTDATAGTSPTTGAPTSVTTGAVTSVTTAEGSTSTTSGAGSSSTTSPAAGGTTTTATP